MIYPTKQGFKTAVLTFDRRLFRADKTVLHKCNKLRRWFRIHVWNMCNIAEKIDLKAYDRMWFRNSKQARALDLRSGLDCLYLKLTFIVALPSPFCWNASQKGPNAHSRFFSCYSVSEPTIWACPSFTGPLSGRMSEEHVVQVPKTGWQVLKVRVTEWTVNIIYPVTSKIVRVNELRTFLPLDPLHPLPLERFLYCFIPLENSYIPSGELPRSFGLRLATDDL